MAKRAVNNPPNSKPAGVSVYTRRDSDKPITRKKGGPSGKRIREDPEFENTRRINREFGGRSTTTRYIRRILKPLLFVADHNVASTINVLLKPVQELDTASEYGQRNIELSKSPHLLQGYAINRRTAFESILHHPIRYTLSKETLTAVVDIPAILPGPNFIVPGNFSFYQFTIVLGIIPDLFFHEYGYRPKPGYEDIVPEIAQTDWYPVHAGSPAQTITLQLPDQLPDTGYSVALAIGIGFGHPYHNDVRAVKYFGGGKILGMA